MEVLGESLKPQVTGIEHVSWLIFIHCNFTILKSMQQAKNLFHSNHFVYVAYFVCPESAYI